MKRMGEKERPDEQEILMRRKAFSWNASSATRNVRHADATVTWLISTFINNSGTRLLRTTEHSGAYEHIVHQEFHMHPICISIEIVYLLKIII